MFDLVPKEYVEHVVRWLLRHPQSGSIPICQESGRVLVTVAFQGLNSLHVVIACAVRRKLVYCFSTK
eukprot:1677898-Amphidinium_carterae.2